MQTVYLSFPYVEDFSLPPSITDETTEHTENIGKRVRLCPVYALIHVHVQCRAVPIGNKRRRASVMENT